MKRYEWNGEQYAGHVHTFLLPFVLVQHEGRARVADEVEKYMQSKLTAQNQLGHGVKVTEGRKPAGSSNNNKTYTWAGIESTARLNNLDPNVVVDRLAKKNNMTVDEFMKLVKQENS